MPVKPRPVDPVPIRDRIKELRRVPASRTDMEAPELRLEYLDPAELAANPANWRRHPPSQIAALKGVLAEVGWAGALLFNERTGRLIDGHARKQIAAKGERVPVLIGSWSEEDEGKILSTLDPLAAMASHDQEALLSLLESVSFQDKAVNDLLEALANDERAPMPELGQELDESMANGIFLCICPTCRHEHSRCT